MTSFAEMRKRNSDVTAITQELEKLNKKADYSSDDDRFWQPTVDKAGNGSATIRFLPESPKDGVEGKQYVRVWNHGFKSASGQWYIENCPTTIGGTCPVCENNGILWHSGIDDNKKIVSTRKRKLLYISNILVINDPAKPENNGKVKLFRYGKKIFDMIESKMNPPFPDDIPYNPFCMETGANFKLRARKFEGNRNYDLSSFDAPTPLFGGDMDKQEQLWNQEYSVLEFIKPSEFKDYETLKKRFDFVIGNQASSSSQPRTTVQSTPQYEDELPNFSSPMRSDPPPTFASSVEEDEDLDFFRSLAS